MAKPKQEKKVSDLSLVLNAINKTKEKLDPEVINKVSPFIVNRMMSLHSDTIFNAYQMSLRHHLPSELQHAYYIHAVDKAYRFGQIPKALKLTDDVSLVQNHYRLSRRKAEDAIKLLGEEELEYLRSLYDEGGVD